MSPLLQPELIRSGFTGFQKIPSGQGRGGRQDDLYISRPTGRGGSHTLLPMGGSGRAETQIRGLGHYTTKSTSTPITPAAAVVRAAATTTKISKAPPGS